MNFCRLCRVHPGAVNVKGFDICHGCLGKSVHAIGAVANHVFTPGVCPPLSHCTDFAGADTSTTPATSTSSSTKQSMITLGMGLFLIAAAVGTFWLYSQSSSQVKGGGMKFGFGLDKTGY